MAALFERIVAKYSAQLQKDLGIKGFQADAIWGNLGHESGGLATLQEGDPRSGVGGYGWAQWTGMDPAKGGRRIAFLRWCEAHKLDPASEEANYGFLVHELLGPYREKVLEPLKATRTRDEAVRLIMAAYETPYDYLHRAENPAAYQRNLNARISWAVRAEQARLLEEGKTTMPEPTPTPAPVPTPTPPIDPNSPESFAQAMQRIERRLEELALNQMSASGSFGGFGPLAAQFARVMFERIDFASYAEAGALKLAGWVEKKLGIAEKPSA